MRLNILEEKAFSGLQPRSLYILRWNLVRIVDLEPSKKRLLESYSNDACDLLLMSFHGHVHGELPLHGNDDEDELFQQHDEHGERQNCGLVNVYLNIFYMIIILRIRKRL